MTTKISRQQLNEAFSTLFGHENCTEQLPSLNSSSLNAAFRKKAFHLHPDRARAQGLPKSTLTHRFNQLQNAHQLLTTYADSKPLFEVGPQSPPAAGSSRRHQSRASREWYNGNMPQRRMQLVEYLAQTQRISWFAQSRSISWQRGQRPKVGQLAVELGYLDRDQLIALMQKRNEQKSWKEPLVSFAHRNGYFDGLAKMAILGKQKKMQRPIGEYFTDRKILTEEQINQALRELSIHNAKFAA